MPNAIVTDSDVVLIGSASRTGRRTGHPLPPAIPANDSGGRGGSPTASSMTGSSVPVRIKIDQVPDGIRLVQGMTATVELHHREKP